MRRNALLVAIALVMPALATGAEDANRNKPKDRGYSYVWDDFKDGFKINTPDAKWFYFSAGPFVGDDGIVTTRPGQGMKVRASGTNARTGKPAFTSTVAPESQSGLAGGIDHVKWLVYMNNQASTGYPGFDAEVGKEFSCEATIGGQTFGTQNHPFGTLVEDPDTDLRLASFALNAVDFETFMVFDFFVTNEQIYAFYERLPFARETLGNYASFSHMIPVHRRKKGDEDRLRVGYDRQAPPALRWPH